MSVIRSVTAQWNKADFARQLQSFLAQEKDICSLFIGATDCTTVCNVIAAMCDELPVKTGYEALNLDLELVFNTLYQPFLLLFVKEVEHGDLSQAEQLILSIMLHYAKLVSAATAVSTPVNTKSLCVLNAMNNLEEQRKLLRKKSTNMGK